MNKTTKIDIYGLDRIIPVFITSELIGAYLGVLGALLVALGPAFAWWGYLSWCISNVALIYFSKKGGYRHLSKMQAIYGITSIYGLYSWY